MRVRVSRSWRSLSCRICRSEYLPSSSCHSLNRSFETDRTASMRSVTFFARSSLRFSSSFSLLYLSSSEPPSTATIARNRSSAVLNSFWASSWDSRASLTRLTRMSRFSQPNFFMAL